MTDSQIARIRKAEQAAKELFDLADEAKREAEAATDPQVRNELLESVEALLSEAQKLADALRKWREDIH